MTHRLTALLLLLASLALPLQAAKPKKRAPKPKKLTDAELMAQATQAFEEYRPDEARDLLDQLAEATDASTLLASRIDRMDAMLQRVADIEVIDSLNVAPDELFAALRLSPSSGSIFNAADLAAAFPVAKQGSGYATQGDLSMIWGGPKGLLRSRRLTDGSMEEPKPYGSNLNAGGVANYPFMMPDGITLYYATQGSDALGGYDLYVTRRDGENFHTPQNMGMPFNSPANDYLLAIDEETGFGLWVTDRNDPSGKLLTIYYFIPSEVRVNVPLTDPKIRQRAALQGIRLTQKSKHADLVATIHRLLNAPQAAASHNSDPDFVFELPDGRILTSWDQIPNAEMRRLMENYVDALQEHNEDAQNLERLRADYARGDHSLAPNILALERKLIYSHSQLKNLSNRVINAAN